MRPVRFGGSGRRRDCGRAAGIAGVTRPGRPASRERGRDESGGRVPSRGRCRVDRVRRTAPVAAPTGSLLLGQGRRGWRCRRFARATHRPDLWRIVSKEAGHDVEKWNPGRVMERGTVVEAPARCHSTCDRGDRRQRPAGRPARQEEGAKAVARRKRAMTEERARRSPSGCATTGPPGERPRRRKRRRRRDVTWVGCSWPGARVRLDDER